MKPYLRAVAGRWNLPWRGLTVLLLTCFILFSAEAVVAVKFSATGAFNYYNILFDADSSEGVAIRAHGWSEDNRSNVQVPNYLHPLINYYTMPVIRVLAKGAAFAHSHGKQSQIREEMALFVSPAGTALAAFAVGLAMMWLNFSPGAAIAAAILYALSYSSLIFGAVPDLFSVSGMSVAMLLAWLAFWIRDTRPISRSGYVAWLLIGFFAAGATISNITVAFIALACAAARRRMVPRDFVRAAAASTSVLVGVVLCAAMSAHLLVAAASMSGVGPKNLNAANPGILSETKALGKYADFGFGSIAAKATDFGLHSVEAFVGLGIHRRAPFNSGEPDDIVPLATDAWSISDIAIGMAFAAMMVVGVYAGLRRRAVEPVRTFAWAGAGVLCANLVLHSVYGRVAFLYSQHWLFAMVFFALLAFAHLTEKWRPALRAGMATILVIAITASNLQLAVQTISLTRTIVADHLRLAI